MSEKSTITFSAVAQLMELLTELSTETPRVEKHRRFEFHTIRHEVPRWSDSKHTGNEREAKLSHRRFPPAERSIYNFSEPVILSLPNRRNRGRSKFISRPPCPVFEPSELETKTRPTFPNSKRPNLFRSNSSPNPPSRFNASKSTHTSYSIIQPTKPSPESNSGLPEKIRLKPYRLSTADTKLVPLSPTSTLCNHSRSSSGLHSDTLHHTEQQSTETQDSSLPLSSDKTNRTSKAAIDSTVHDINAKSILPMYFDCNKDLPAHPSIRCVRPTSDADNKVCSEHPSIRCVRPASDADYRKIFSEYPSIRCTRPTSDTIKSGWKQKWKWFTKAWDRHKDAKSGALQIKYNGLEGRWR